MDGISSVRKESFHEEKETDQPESLQKQNEKDLKEQFNTAHERSSSSATVSPPSILEFLKSPTSVLTQFYEQGKQWTHEHPQTAFGIATFALTILSSPPGLYLIHWFLLLLRTIIGLSVGLGLGLGLASHVADQLQVWQEEQQQYPRRRRGGEDEDGTAPPFPSRRNQWARTTSNMSNSTAGYTTTPSRPSFLLRSTSNPIPPVHHHHHHQDEQTYASLMASAGYLTVRYAEQGLPLTYLRGQHVATPELQQQPPRYLFDRATNLTAVNCLQTLWPSLPQPIHQSLGRAMELIVRDYVASWYSLVDPGCVYVDPKAAAAANGNDAADNKDDETTKTLSTTKTPTLLTSLATHRPLPFCDAMYTVLGTILGHLATRVEHNTNVFDLLLMQWPRILAHTFQWYRVARRNVMANGTTEKHREWHMAREFFYLHKYHRAISFGLDVPSLLFTGNDDEDSQYERVLATVAECELDYHRVVGHRMVKALLQHRNTASTSSSTLDPLLISLLTEVMGSCVLTPILAMMGPDYINAWIVMGLKPSDGTDSTTAAATAAVDTSGDEGVGGEDTNTKDAAEPGIGRDDDEQDEDQKPPAPAQQEDVALLTQKTLQDLVADNVEGGLMHMLAMTLMELQTHIDFDECRHMGAGAVVDWDDDGCRAAVLRLVLVIEAALSHGRCATAAPPMSPSDPSVEVTLPEYESTTLTQLFMEMTSDVDAFAEDTTNAEPPKDVDETNEEDQHTLMTTRTPDYVPTPTDQSTLRTLIAAWLHAGEVYKTVSLVAQSNVFAHYYHPSAFLRSPMMRGFVRQLRALSDVHMVVDTMSVLTSPRLEELGEGNEGLLVAAKTTASSVGTQRSNETAPPLAASAQFFSSSALPRHLDFHRNESFASSLRAERERRRLSWERIVEEDESPVDSTLMVHRVKAVSEEEMSLHKELHHLARVFYAGTNMLALRNAARRTMDDENQEEVVSDVQVSLLTVETASSRRRFEVPDDDSSFLLRAQPRPLNAVGVHRDQRNHDQSFKCFTATYETPALPAASEHYTGGRYIRRCLIRYYPIDRTASVALQNDLRKLDQRKTQSLVPDTITLGQSAARPFLSSEFLKERHLCQRWVPKGTTRSQSLLASSVMEPTDFTATPRTGKAIDFVYRMSFFERPMLDLGGKHFTVHDSSSLGAHRADASALELSDASLSAALLTLGVGDDDGQSQGVFEMGPDGYPVVWMKLSRKQDDSHVEVKPYRAALLVTATRQEAQLRCLVKCVKAGSAKKATKSLTDLYLRPTLKILEFAGSRNRTKEGALLRDLKLGVAHLDREQLRRNALLSPRYPTQIIDVSTTIEEAPQASDPKSADLFGSNMAVFRIKCSAKVAFAALEDEFPGHEGYRGQNNAFPLTFREEWVVYRTLKDFQSLHKHLKTQVAVSESSGNAGSRLVGAATAAFAATASMQGRSRQRSVLLPSLAQATKAGALGVSKKAALRRKEQLDSYLGYLLSAGNPLGRSSEILLFLGALFPLSLDVHIGKSVATDTDILGRTDMFRKALRYNEEAWSENPSEGPSPNRTALNSTMESEGDSDDDILDDDDEGDPFRKGGRKENMIPAISAKIDKVKLPIVRNRIFELLRYQFGFDNASFARNRLLTALKTISMAVTSANEFRNTLYKLHVEYLNSEAIAGWIDFLTEMLWPNGVFFESSPPPTAEDLSTQAKEAKELLHGSFPDQLRAILGPELTQDGMDIFFEMLQNRLIVKSMAYMIFDLLWLEIFPEIGDVLQGGAALDIDK